MNWYKQGLLFSVESLGPNRPNWLASHAAVPLVDRTGGGETVVYFSSRDAKNRSHTARSTVDFTAGLPAVKTAPELVLGPGDLGAFDDSGAMGSWLVTLGGRKYLYYVGWNLSVSVPFRNAIGLAVSDDGGRSYRRWSKGPILDRDTCDPFFTGSACVLIDNGRWRMWYLSCVEWTVTRGVARHRYHIKYAESRDGIRWTRTGVVAIDFQSDAEYAISRPCVIRDGRTYKMWYSHRGASYRIGYAESFDGIHWSRLDDRAGIDVGPEAWDLDMIEYPFVFDRGAERIMLYNGNDFGRTGIGWAIQRRV